jgi:four helix bundle protein
VPATWEPSPRSETVHSEIRAQFCVSEPFSTLTTGIERACSSRVGVSRFEDLRVWQAAKQQCDRVGVLLIQPAFQRDRKLSDQMNDAALSVLFNISEGFLRRRDKETLQFLRYSFASNGELKAGYYVANGRNYLSAAETSALIDLNERIAKMLRRWQATLELGDPRKPRQSRGPKDQGRGTDQGPGTDEGPRP